MQKQSSTISLPVIGAPNCCDPASGFGVAPYVGRSVISLEGYTAPAADPYAQSYLAGTYGSAVGEFQLFPNGVAAGNLNFNNNDNFNTVGYSVQVNCYYNLFQLNNFADGTSNDGYRFNGSDTCGSATQDFSDQTSAVQWGPTDESSYFIVTSNGLSNISDMPFAIAPAGETIVGTTYPNGSAGRVTNTVVPQTLAAPHTTSTGYVALTNTTAAAGYPTLTMPPASDGTCSLSMVSFPLALPEPVYPLVPPNSPSTKYATITCTCLALFPADSVSPTLTLSIHPELCRPHSAVRFRTRSPARTRKVRELAEPQLI